MRIIATDFHTLLGPAQCERRVYLDARATETAEASESHFFAEGLRDGSRLVEGTSDG